MFESLHKINFYFKSIRGYYKAKKHTYEVREYYVQAKNTGNTFALFF